MADITTSATAVSTKFAKTLAASNGDIKALRAQQLSEQTVIEVEAFLQNLKREKAQLNTRITNLTDLAPDNTYSLRPGAKDFDAVAWIKELHKTRMDLNLKAIELEEAEAIFNEWFKPETV